VGKRGYNHDEDGNEYGPTEGRLTRYPPLRILTTCSLHFGDSLRQIVRLGDVSHALMTEVLGTSASPRMEATGAVR